MTENARPGNPPSEWDLPGKGAGDLTIQGFATDISVNKGDTVHFKISTLANNYTIDIYRLGYYNGDGARKVGTGVITATLPQIQPPPLEDVNTGLVDCGNWSESAYWAVADTLVSGIYIAKLTRTDNNGASHITFIVRDDSSSSDLFFQASDATWQAYNVYGGNSLYVGTTSFPNGHAAKVSYNRPFLSRSGGGGGGAQQDWIFNAEYPMIRFLERNGYDVTYTTNTDAARYGNLILNHKVFLSVGHDEYWSAEQRNNVTAARNAGVHLAFFSGNEIYWKTRWENSIDSTGTPYRTLVCYKEGTLGEAVCGTKCDTTPVWTGLWRYGSAYDAGLPENMLSGQISWKGSQGSIKVPSTYKNLRFWRNTSIASLADGTEAVLPDGTLGYEWNQQQFDKFYPGGRITMSKTNKDSAIHKLSLYRHSNGALVFGAGTVQWSWGLDSVHDRGSLPPDTSMQQATINLFADMGTQPATLQSGLVPASATTDFTAPASGITLPPDSSEVVARSPVTISGTSSDAGGVVAGVEVSTDGGLTWAMADGDTSWSYTWTPQNGGTITIKTRAFDDSGNMEAEGTAPSSNAITLYILNPECPCTIFQTSDNPVTKNAYNGTPGLELGVKFKSDSSGFIRGIRYYKSSLDTGTHVVSLWSAAGALLARDSLTPAEEKLSGWHEALFDTAVAIDSEVVYVASYHSKTGYHSKTTGFFADSIVNGMLTGLQNDSTGGNYNGVNLTSTIPVFPTNASGAANYWVDVSFITANTVDTIPPLVESLTPDSSQTNVAITTPVQVSFSELIDLSSINDSTFILTDSSHNVVVPATINAVQDLAELTPSSPLLYSSVYTVFLKGGPDGVKDLAGNTLSDDTTWTFTTQSTPAILPPEGPGGPILVLSSSTSPFSRYTAEILKAEGLNEYRAQDISEIDSAALGNYDVAILGEMNISAPQVSMLTNWVNAGGKLIAFRPAAELHSLLGITQVAGTLSDKYLLIDTSASPGKGIVGETIQYHDAADLYTLNGATNIATLYSDASTATAYSAVTINSVGSNGGKAIAFAYDLPRSIVYTRQGNPALAGVETDGQSPIRANDMFFPGYLDTTKVAIPQADEQQRLLANIIIQTNLAKKPLPRFWYMPKQHKAAIIYALDDHGTSTGTRIIFDKFLDNSPVGSVEDWETYRATSWFYVGIPLSQAQAYTYNSQGFEMGVHVQNGCSNFTSHAALDAPYDAQFLQFTNAYPGLPPQTTHRFHCLSWSDWLTQAEVELHHGVRLSLDYYYWPTNWVGGRPGLFTGSGIPMRFANLDGTIIDIYQGVSQLVNENGINYTVDVNTLLDNAQGPKGYYGFFGTHDDFRDQAFSDAAIAAAQSHNVPIISARQMLNWLDGRNAASFNNIIWNNDQLTFTVVKDSLARNLTGMLPLFSDSGQLVSITRGSIPVAFNAQKIKGIDYAFFTADSGTYVANYGPVYEGTLIGRVKMQGRPAAPDTILQVPLVVTLYLNGDTAQAQTYYVVTDQNGSFTIDSIPLGSYSISVKHSHTLKRVKTLQSIVLGPNTIDFGTLLEGDVNNDNYVDGLDASLLLNSFYKGVGNPGYNPQADLNGDHFVDGLDASLLLNNFYKSGEEP